MKRRVRRRHFTTEQLETRELLSGISLSNRVVVISGTSAADSVLIEPFNANQLRVTLANSQTSSAVFALRQVDAVQGHLRSGNDVFHMDELPIPVTLYGQGGNDTLYGGTGADAIFGGPGNDSIRGGRGNDSLFGNKGNDRLFGENGSDKLRGASGNDWLNGGAVHDRLFGGGGVDWLIGEHGNDQLYGETGDDWVNGGNGTDTLLGGPGSDHMRGGLDDDLVTGEDGDDTLYGGWGNDTVTGGNDDDTIYGDVNDRSEVYRPVYRNGKWITAAAREDANDRVDGGPGNDHLEGDFGHDTVFGRSGDDAIYKGLYDTVDPGPGNDLILRSKDDGISGGGSSGGGGNGGGVGGGVVRQPRLETTGVSDGGTIDFGTRSTNSKAFRTIRFRNAGSATLRLSLNRISSGFGINQRTVTLNPGLSREVRISMDTRTPGTRFGVLRFDVNDPNNNVFQVSLRGEVKSGIEDPPPEQQPNAEIRIGGSIVRSSGTHDFGSVVPGDGAMTTLSITNNGDAPLRLTNVSRTGPFTVTGLSSGMVVDPGTTARITVAPTDSAGTKTGLIRFRTNDAEQSSVEVTLKARVLEDGTNPSLGRVTWSETVTTSQGMVRLKQTERFQGGNGNQLRLWGDFYNLSGQLLKRNVPIGDHNKFGNQQVPRTVELENGNLVVAWVRESNPPVGVRFVILNSQGNTVGSRDRKASIQTSGQFRIAGVQPRDNGGFRILWFHSSVDDYGGLARNFNSLGTGTSAEYRWRLRR